MARVRVMTLALALVGACARPGSSPAVFDELVSVTHDSTAHVRTPFYTMDFGQSGIKLPAKMTHNGTSLLASAGCPSESLVGVAVFPIITVAAGTAGTSEITTPLEGPAIARVEVDWIAPFECHGPTQATGTSSFTFFPSGRIVRTDRDVLASDATIEGGCGCGTVAEYFFTSFWTFPPGNEVDSTGESIADGTNPSGEQTQRACVTYQDYSIGLTWSDSNTRVVNNGGNSNFVHDWIATNSPTVPSVKSTVSSSIIVSDRTLNSDCALVLEGLEDPAILFGNRRAEASDDGIYRDPANDAKSFDITVAEPLEHGFAISIAVDHAQITRDPAPEPGELWYVTQNDMVEHRTLVWFEKGLAPGEKITVDPQP